MPQEETYYAANRDKILEAARKRHAANPEKGRAYARKWREANKATVVERNRRYNGLPLPTRPVPELCEMNCGRKATHLDHDHITGKFRGWLCHKCNVGIGIFGDTLEGLQAGLQNGIDYLKRPQI